MVPNIHAYCVLNLVRKTNVHCNVILVIAGLMRSAPLSRSENTIVCLLVKIFGYALPAVYQGLLILFFSSSASSSGESLHSSNPQIDEATRYKEQIKSYYKYNMSIAHLNINSLFNKVDKIG